MMAARAVAQQPTTSRLFFARSGTGIKGSIAVFKIIYRDERGVWERCQVGWSTCGVPCAWADGYGEGSELIEVCTIWMRLPGRIETSIERFR
jgi:hypothetical protein